MPFGIGRSPQDKRNRTVADLLVAQLIEAGVRRIYGIVGDSLNPVVDAVHRSNAGENAGKGIEWIHVRHEEAAAFAAAAEAEVTGSLAVCAGSCGPGTSTSSTACTTPTGRACPCSPSRATSRASRSAPGSSRRPTPTACSRSAPSTPR